MFGLVHLKKKVRVQFEDFLRLQWCCFFKKMFFWQSLRKRITFSWHLSQSQHTVELNFWKYSRNQARINGPRFLELIINSISWTPSLQIFCNFEAISWYFPSFLSSYLQSYFSLRIAKSMIFQVQFFWSTTNQIWSPGFYHMFIPNNEIP